MDNHKIAAAAAPLLILVFAACSFAQETATTPAASSLSKASSLTGSISHITIKNFGQMNENFYRGAQPKDEDYKALAALGVKVIIDLRNDPLSSARSAVEAANMRYVNIPMSDKRQPKQEAVDEFLKLTEDKSNWPFYVHCIGGRHRTGLMGAVYRFNRDGWDYEKAYQEMKKYDYYSRWGHKEIKRYVEQYWQRFQSNTARPGSVLVQTSK